DFLSAGPRHGHNPDAALLPVDLSHDRSRLAPARNTSGRDDNGIPLGFDAEVRLPLHVTFRDRRADAGRLHGVSGGVLGNGARDCAQLPASPNSARTSAASPTAGK